MLRSNPVPRRIVTDQLRSHPAAKAGTREPAHVKHVFVKAAARVNNRAGNSHQRTRRRERQMPAFRDARRAQAFLSRFGPAALCFAQTSNESGKSSCRTLGTLRHMVRLDRNCLNRYGYAIRIATIAGAPTVYVGQLDKAV